MRRFDDDLRAVAQEAEAAAAATSGSPEDHAYYRAVADTLGWVLGAEPEGKGRLAELMWDTTHRAEMEAAFAEHEEVVEHAKSLLDGAGLGVVNPEYVRGVAELVGEVTGLYQGHDREWVLRQLGLPPGTKDRLYPPAQGQE